MGLEILDQVVCDCWQLPLRGGKKIASHWDFFIKKKFPILGVLVYASQVWIVQ